MQSHPTTETQLLELMERRASLLSEEGGPGATTASELREVTEELTSLLSVAAPQVRRIGPGEPGDLLARLVRAEPVHPFDTDDVAGDLADRLAADRRCFVLEHPLLPGHPMNVVWVALWKGLATRISDVLDPAAATLDPATADTAVFYSIWNVEQGLVGIPGGRSLLAGAIRALQAELPGIEEFVTLSPVPGFRAWSEQHGHDATDLARRCATYLTSFGDDGRLLDPVARFHLANGARLWRLQPDADRSDRGMARSYGLMANYHYAPEDRAANRESLRSGRPAVSAEIAELAQDPARDPR